MAKPLAVLGTLVHAAIEYGWGRERLLMEIAERTIGWYVMPGGLINLRDAVDPSKVQRILRRLPIGDRTSTGSSGSNSGQPLSRKEHEKDLEAFDGRLRGIADFVEEEPGRVRVTDFKTGRVLEPSGDARSGYRTQLEVYGAMLRDGGERRAIRLRLFGLDGEVEWAMTDEAADLVAEMVADADHYAPLGKDRSVLEAARPGSHCAICSYRHRCSAYLAFMPRVWDGQATVDDGPTVDTWGEVIGSTRKVDGYYRVAIRDPAGRRVTVSGVPLDRPLESGELVSFFGVRREWRAGSLPNYFLLAEPLYKSALNAAVFVGRSPA